MGSQELPELGNREESLARGLDQHELCWRRCRDLPALWSPGGSHPAFAKTLAPSPHVAPHLGKLEQEAGVGISSLIPHPKKL